MWSEREDYSMEIQDTKKIFITYSTDDKSEGRTAPWPWLISESQTTAKRLGKKKYIQGSDSPVEEDIAVKINNTWYAPCRIIQPNNDDSKQDKIIEQKQALLDRQNLAIERAKELGLSAEDVEILTTINNP